MPTELIDYPDLNGSDARKTIHIERFFAIR